MGADSTGNSLWPIQRTLFRTAAVYYTFMLHWWWKGMYNDAVGFVKACPECAVVSGTGRRIKPPLHPIPVSQPFQVLGIDVMDLPMTERGNKHVVMVQDLFSKWPFVFAVPDQKSSRIAQLLAEVIPSFGVPECLLSDQGTNLPSHLMMDLCQMLGIKNLNTTSYHPQCDGAVERFNRTLKTILRKHAARFGCQWDRYLPGILWAYRNTPRTSTGELSRPWHGPYQIIKKVDPDVTCVKVYFPQEGELQIHQSRVCTCPREFPAGYYWHGGRRRGLVSWRNYDSC